MRIRTSERLGVGFSTSRSSSTFGGPYAVQIIARMALTLSYGGGVPFLVPRLDISVGFGNFFQRKSPVDHRPNRSCFGERTKTNDIFRCWIGYAKNHSSPAGHRHQHPPETVRETGIGYQIPSASLQDGDTSTDACLADGIENDVIGPLSNGEIFLGVVDGLVCAQRPNHLPGWTYHKPP